ncbi:MAG: 50S ribosomal protein L13 [Kiritimatiellae bacterium]|nr:50S ribosomal protein L13 [Kiritimatiellia bacterium]MDD3545558.1 50S ribosomal protein L13 [Kiritimatiellia bacterium]MDD4025741.1 50S ribosomal protein L13 [Kiritimatiellia bacterium]MDD4623134.1 50S ribosomal protein L13 [Kiritimatiellia bacterium]
MTKTFVPKDPGTARGWHLVDAADKPLGRLAVNIANTLRGKNRRDFDPSVDMGDFVIVVNAEKVRLTGRKVEQKEYQRYSGWRGGLKRFSAKTMLEKHPDRVIMEAVWGMLPKNNISRNMMTRVKVYRGSEHPHAAQTPVAAAF